MFWQRFALLQFRLLLREPCAKYSLFRCASCIRQLQTVPSTVEVATSGPVATQPWPTAGVRWLPTATKEAVSLDTKSSVKKTEISYEELSKLVDAGTLQLYDVREPADVNQTGVINSAINIPLTKLKVSLQLEPEQFETQFGATKPAKDGRNVVFYGFSSVKSTAAVEIAHKLGFKRARHFPGGWEQWSRSRKKI